MSLSAATTFFTSRIIGRGEENRTNGRGVVVIDGESARPQHGRVESSSNLDPEDEWCMDGSKQEDTFHGEQGGK